MNVGAASKEAIEDFSVVERRIESRPEGDPDSSEADQRRGLGKIHRQSEEAQHVQHKFEMSQDYTHFTKPF